MTFEEQAYKERELFAKINKVRAAESSSLLAGFQKDAVRQDFGQQKNKNDQVVSFTRSIQSVSGPIRMAKGLRQTAKDRSAFSVNKGKNVEKTTMFSRGGQNTVSEGSTWDSGGYQERAKPTVLQSQGLLDKKPLSLISNNTKRLGRLGKKTNG